MATETTILHDPRYWAFAEQYASDPLAFAVSVCGMSPSRDQERLLKAMAPSPVKVSVVSGTSTGKTAAFARIALWHFLCNPAAFYEDKLEIGSNTYIGASRIKQVADGVWKEMTDVYLAISDGPFAWLNDYYTIASEQVTMKGFEKTWFISQVAMQQGKAIGVAGKHRYWQLIIIDEAAGVSDDHFDVIEGTQTQPGNRTLMASQGVRSTGRFFDSHHGRSIDNGGSWLPLVFNSEHSPFVTKQWLKEIEEESGGKDSIEYKIRIRGLFAEDTGNILLTREDMEKAFSAGKIIGEDEPYGIFILGDVGMGEYRDESITIVAKVIGLDDHGPDARRVEYFAMPICSNTKDEIDYAGDMVNLYGQYSNATMLVDNGGIGHAVNKLLERDNVPVVKIDWGKPCFKKEFKNRFYNRRACAMVRFRDAIRSGRVSITFSVSNKIKDKIITQGSRLPYHFAEAGGLKYVMMRKEVMRENGIASPDIIDDMAFAWLEDAAQYIVREGYFNADSAGHVMQKKVNEMFADVE